MLNRIRDLYKVDVTKFQEVTVPSDIEILLALRSGQKTNKEITDIIKKNRKWIYKRMERLNHLNAIELKEVKGVAVAKLKNENVRFIHIGSEAIELLFPSIIGLIFVMPLAVMLKEFALLIGSLITMFPYYLWFAHQIITKEKFIKIYMRQPLS